MEQILPLVEAVFAVGLRRRPVSQMSQLNSEFLRDFLGSGFTARTFANYQEFDFNGFRQWKKHVQL